MLQSIAHLRTARRKQAKRAAAAAHAPCDEKLVTFLRAVFNNEQAFQDVAKRLAQHDVTYSILIDDISENHLREMGLSIGHRIDLLKAVGKEHKKPREERQEK